MRSFNNYVYQIRSSLYLNITNRCPNHCEFCVRNFTNGLAGVNLFLQKEPDFEELKQAIFPFLSVVKEIVFCGYGEPTIRWDVVKTVAKYIKENGGRTRLNTNGHGNVINKIDITPELSGLIDEVSISLNTFNPKQYGKLMGLNVSYFNEMINFAKSAKQYVEKVIMSIVYVDEVDIERSRKIAEEKIGAEFRVREYF